MPHAVTEEAAEAAHVLTTIRAREAQQGTVPGLLGCLAGSDPYINLQVVMDVRGPGTAVPVMEEREITFRINWRSTLTCIVMNDPSEVMASFGWAVGEALPMEAHGSTITRRIVAVDDDNVWGRELQEEEGGELRLQPVHIRGHRTIAVCGKFSEQDNEVLISSLGRDFLREMRYSVFINKDEGKVILARGKWQMLEEYDEEIHGPYIGGE